MSGRKLVPVFLVPFMVLLLFSHYTVSAQRVALDSRSLNSTFDVQSATTCSITDPQVIDEGVIEQKFTCDDHHFMSILLTPNNAVALRPHPGCNVDAWGSTWYIQPFLQYSDPSGTIIDSLEAVEGKIYVMASGEIAGWDPPPATWMMDLEIEYDKSSKTITGTGSYSIQLPGTLLLDLNLYRIASNYLDDVPLISGGIGDTGDLKEVIVSGNGPGFPFTWHPPEMPEHFPTQSSSYLSINAVGQYNNVDAEDLGYKPINPAYKPSLEIALTANNEDVQMTFGGIYDVNQGQNPYSDNIGITPLIKVGTAITEFQFEVDFTATALPDEHCESTGLYDPQTSWFYLLNANEARPFDIKFKKGLASGGWLPIAGNWDGDALYTAGLYDPQTSWFYLLNANQAQPFDIKFKKGLAGGGWLPIAGDWNGDGIDTVGLYDSQTSRFYLLNANQAQPFDITFKKGLAGGGWLPIAGDWDNN
jgi:hypothetical protein